MRPYLSLLLKKKGFHISEYPAKGIKGLICGKSHVPNRKVDSHRKYTLAVTNGVPLVPADTVPSALGMTFEEFKQELDILSKEINMKKGGDKQDIIHFTWNSKLRFILLSEAAHQAL